MKRAPGRAGVTTRQAKRLRHKEGHHANQMRKAREREAELAARARKETEDLAQVDQFFGEPDKSAGTCDHQMSDGATCARDPGHDGRHSKTRLKKDG